MVETARLISKHESWTNYFREGWKRWKKWKANKTAFKMDLMNHGDYGALVVNAFLVVIVIVVLSIAIMNHTRTGLRLEEDVDLKKTAIIKIK